MKLSLKKTSLRFFWPRKVNSKIFEFNNHFLVKKINRFVFLGSFYFLIALGASILFFFLSMELEDGNANSSLVNLLKKEDLSFIELYGISIQNTFNGTMPSINTSSLSISGTFETFWQSFILLILSVIMASFIGFVLFMIKKNMRENRLRKVILFVFGLDRTLSPLIIVSILTAILFSLSNSDALLFNQNDPSTWLFPILLVSFPSSNYVFRIFDLIREEWRASEEVILVSSFGKLGKKLKENFIFKRVIFSGIRNIYFLMFGTLILQIIIEPIIGFNGFGTQIINNIKDSEIWLNLGVLYLFITTILIYSTLSTFWNKKSIIERK